MVHEFGHFVMAKKHGVLVEEFGLGFGPRVWGIKFGETLYSINLFPFGGFVKPFGQEREELKGKKLSPELQKRTYVGKTHWQKISIIVAGVFFNFLLGWIIISYLFTQGVPTPTKEVIVQEVLKDSPAFYSGVLKGDIVSSFSSDSQIFEITSVDNLISLSKKNAGHEVILTIKRGNDNLKIKATPRQNPGTNEGSLGIMISSFKIKKYPWYKAPFLGLVEAATTTYLIAEGTLVAIFRFVTFQKVGAEAVGPVGLAVITSGAVKTGFQSVLNLLGLLSLNLAVINILPFPALDGGHLVLIFYEMITKRRVNAKIERRMNYVGFAILLSLITLITIKDIAKIFIK